MVTRADRFYSSFFVHDTYQWLAFAFLHYYCTVTVSYLKFYMILVNTTEGTSVLLKMLKTVGPFLKNAPVYYQKPSKIQCMEEGAFFWKYVSRS